LTGQQSGGSFRGAIGKGLGKVGDALGWGARVLGVDAFALAFGNTIGKAWTLGLDIMDIGSASRSFGNSPLMTALGTLGKALVSLPINLAFPNYGFYNERGYGLRQFPNGIPNPLNRLGQAGLNHDRSYVHRNWIRDAWSPGTPGLATGPLWLVYQTVGTVFFGAAGAFQ
jgi:hypothetical protein